MKRLFASLLLLSVATSAMADVAIRRVVCHDPSIVVDTVTTGTPESPVYYIYGSHLGNAKTTADLNYINWTVFAKGEDATTSNDLFLDANGNNSLYSKVYADAHNWQYKGNSVKGMQWAPDIIYNTTMKKWCMYMSLNGDYWCSSIVLFTSDRPDGGWQYVGPVVYSGFQGKYDHVGYKAANDYQHTDLEKAIGKVDKLPARYDVGDKWGDFWPNCIDPCVFYDAEGKLWMSYGSWSGGIFIFELDESTGLRDYNVKYPEECTTAGDYRSCTSDPYFGRKIAGGYYVSGEASYIQRIGDYYYLFMSYGGLSAVGDYYGVGYQMRVFRSQKPDGPYKDCLTASGQSAIYSKYMLNFGHDAVVDRGVRLMSAYKWDSMSKGEIAQGHNSAIVDHEGRALVVYHTRNVNNGEGHSVRVHQLFQNVDGWLVAAPYEYYGETVTQEDIDNRQEFSAEQVAGDYQLIIHKYRQNAVTQEYAKPETITLTADGKVTGAYSGSWSLVEGTGHIKVTLTGVLGRTTAVAFKGVVVAQTVKPGQQALCFTVLSSSSGVAGSNATRGLCIWGTQTNALSDIPQLETEDTAAKIFDLQGHPLEHLQQGLNVVNGRIIYIK